MPSSSPEGSLGALPAAASLASVAIFSQEGLALTPTVTNNQSGSTATSTTSATANPIWSSFWPSLGPQQSPNPPLAAPLVIASSFPPIPAKLVEKIRSGKYTDMRELLPDNSALLQALEAMNPLQAGLPTKPRLREVDTILTWAYCFMGYVSIRTEDPLTRDLLTYARLLIRESRKHGGDGWKAYDTVFRANAAATTSAEWTKLDPSLHAATLVANRSGQGLFCQNCFESDHSPAECALATIKPESTKEQPPPANTNRIGEIEAKGSKRKDPRTRFSPYAAPYKGTPGHICHFWNNGRCIFPNRCRLEHICTICYKSGKIRDHPARECPESPAGDRGEGSRATHRGNM